MTLTLDTARTWMWTDHAIHVVEAGDPDALPILLIHGFGGSTNHWRHNIPVLAEHHHVFAIDLLGFGASAKPVQPYSAEVWIDQVQAFCRECIQRPTVLAGNSVGGYVALATAADYPELACGVVLLNAAGSFTSSTQPTPWQQLQRSFMKALLNQRWIGHGIFHYVRQPSQIRQQLQKVYYDTSAITDQLVDDIYQPTLDPQAADVFCELIKGGQRGRKVDELLRILQHPLLLIWGEKDPWMNAKARSEQFRAVYTDLEEHVLTAGHCPHDETPEQVNQLIHQWMSEVVRPRVNA